MSDKKNNRQRVSIDKIQERRKQQNDVLKKIIEKINNDNSSEDKNTKYSS